MKLYDRLLMEGIFLFWEDDEKVDYYIIDCYINNLGRNIKIKSEKIEGKLRCYSLDKIGYGEYYVEISSYKNNDKIDFVERKIILESSNVKISEINELFSEFYDKVKITFDYLDQQLESIEKVLEKILEEGEYIANIIDCIDRGIDMIEGKLSY